MPEFTIKSRIGETTFQSNHPNQRALYDRLVTLVSRKEIVNDHADRLIAGYRRYGSWKNYHEAWAAFHVARVDHPERFQQGNRTQPASVTGMQPIVDHLRGALDHLKSPVIVLEVGDEPNVQTVVLKYNTRGKKPGSVGVSQSTRFGEGQFYGYIVDDEFEPRSSTNGTDVVSILQRVAADPARVISEIGRQSGRCCYCPAKLTQVQSKIAGCGKTCARNYDIDYPNAARVREILSDQPEFLVGATDADRWS
jgi:hypothetical protein